MIAIYNHWRCRPPHPHHAHDDDVNSDIDDHPLTGQGPSDHLSGL